MGVIGARQHAFALGFFLPRLGLVEAPVVAAPGHEFVVGAFFHFLAFVHDDEAVGLVEGGEAVGDGDGGAAFDEVVQRFLDFALGFGIDRGGGFVEDEDARVDEQRAGDAQALALAA